MKVFVLAATLRFAAKLAIPAGITHHFRTGARIVHALWWWVERSTNQTQQTRNRLRHIRVHQHAFAVVVRD
jgi:putative Ca2+/H+ antiporter (TMEM165/GDT1 family)